MNGLILHHQSSMNQWINESMNQWINESMNQWINQWWRIDRLNKSIDNKIDWQYSLIIAIENSYWEYSWIIFIINIHEEEEKNGEEFSRNC
jgi:hypothetical protein